MDTVSFVSDILVGGFSFVGYTSALSYPSDLYMTALQFQRHTRTNTVNDGFYCLTVSIAPLFAVPS